MFDVQERDIEFRNVREMVTPGVLAAIEQVPPEYLEMTPRELEKLSRRKAFSSTDRAIRVNFWNEYTRASAKGCTMRVAHIVQGVCSPAHFHSTFLREPARVAFMLIPPVEFNQMKKILSEQAMETIQEIMDTPHLDAEGKINSKVMDAKLKAAALAIQLDQGAIVQRIENKNLNMNASISVEDKRTTPQSMEEIEARLAELDRPTLVVESTQTSEPIEVISVQAETYEIKPDDIIEVT
jgi:hypothetical protein